MLAKNRGALPATIAAALTLALIAVLPASAASRARPADCPQKFLALWLWNRDEAMAHMPKRPCLLQGEHDQYVCDPNGCAAAR